MTTKGLLQFFESRRARDEPVVLATVFETEGSTYSKAGSRMLIDHNGVFQGMLSGGCLEGDLAVRAAVVIESGQPQIVDYDLANDDELWGLGVGCDGAIRVFLQCLTAAGNYQPFTAIAEVLGGTEPAVATTVIESSSDAVSPGVTAVWHREGVSAPAVAGALVEAADASARKALSDGTSTTARIDLGDGRLRVLHAVVKPPPRLLVLGAGLDAEPVVRFATELGWRCTIADHRQAYIDNGDFAVSERTVCVPADEIARSVDLATFDLAVVMSHHLASDRHYLRQLAETDIGYVGLLGPPGRRDRLLSELGKTGERLRDRLHGPAGLDIGGRGPAAIALSIVAEMQQVLAGNR